MQGIGKLIFSRDYLNRALSATFIFKTLFTSSSRTFEGYLRGKKYKRRDGVTFLSQKNNQWL